MIADQLAGCEPCHFCGSHDLTVNGHGSYTVIICCSCLAEGPHGTLSTAIKNWNTRTPTRSDLEIELAHLKAEAARWREVAEELAKMLELSRATCLMDCGPVLAESWSDPRIDAALTRFKQESGQ